MKLYRFSPIKDKKQLLKAIKYVHFSCHNLCKQATGKYLPNAGNIGIFCHYESEYEILVNVRNELCENSNNHNKKYFKLKKPIVIKAKGDIPKIVYTYLYIRKADPYRAQVGDVDFYLEKDEYEKLKKSLSEGKKIDFARIYPRQDLDMIELHNPDIDVLSYVVPEMFKDE